MTRLCALLSACLQRGVRERACAGLRRVSDLLCLLSLLRRRVIPVRCSERSEYAVHLRGRGGGGGGGRHALRRRRLCGFRCGCGCDDAAGVDRRRSGGGGRQKEEKDATRGERCEMARRPFHALLCPIEIATSSGVRKTPPHTTTQHDHGASAAASRLA